MQFSKLWLFGGGVSPCMKRCPKCERELPDSDFAFKNQAKGLLQHSCRKCHAKIRKQHYQNNRQKYIDKATRYRRSVSEWFQKFKATLSCVQCGYSHPAAIDFHHQSGKVADVSMIVHASSREAALAEIQKCIPLCANCHRVHHYKQPAGPDENGVTVEVDRPSSPSSNSDISEGADVPRPD